MKPPLKRTKDLQSYQLHRTDIKPSQGASFEMGLFFPWCYQYRICDNRSEPPLVSGAKVDGGHTIRTPSLPPSGGPASHPVAEFIATLTVIVQPLLELSQGQQTRFLMRGLFLSSTVFLIRMLCLIFLVVLDQLSPCGLSVVSTTQNQLNLSFTWQIFKYLKII